MPPIKRFRHNLPAFILWGIFLVLYLGGTLLLLLGVIFSAQAWWTLIRQEASLWAIGMTTGEIFVMAAAFFMLVLIPLLQRRGAGRVNSRQEVRRFGLEQVSRSSNQIA